MALLLHRNPKIDGAEGTFCDTEGPRGSPARPRRRWKAVVAGFVVLLALLGLRLCHPTLLQAVAGLLIVNEEPISGDVEVDYVWIRTSDGMNADGDRCYDWAAKLYESGESCHILLSVPPPSRLVQAGAIASFKETSLRELSVRGVPLEVVITIEGNNDPWLEARSLEAWLKGKPNARVLLLSNCFGSRRWSHVLDTMLEQGHRDKVKIWGLPDREWDETNWWQTRSGFKEVFNAYVELAYAWCLQQRGPRWEWQSPDEYERTFLKTVEQAE